MGRSLLELLPRLAARTPIVALVDARRPVPDLGVATEAVAAPKGLPRLGWLELGVAPWVARHPGTLLHGAAYALPLRHRDPAVLTLHDVAWEAHPRDFGWAKRHVWRRSARRSVDRAGAVITVSEFSKREIVAIYGIDPDDVLVAPNAPGRLFRPRPSDAAARGDAEPAVRSAAGVGGAPTRPAAEPAGRRLGRCSAPDLPARYVVALGGAVRRNLPLAVDAWRRAAATSGGVGLVVVGPEQPPVEPGITWLGAVDDATWASVLAGADAFVYPTSYEGFGMPAAEACACGVPVVCARVASLPEVLGDAAAWAPGLDAGGFASTLASLLTDDARRREVAAASLARAGAASTWEDAADITVDGYERAWRRQREAGA